MLLSASEDSEEERPACIKGNAKSSVPVLPCLDTSESNDPPAGRAMQCGIVVENRKRDQHERTAESKKRLLNQAEQAGQHLALIKKYSTSLGKPCGSKCPNNGKWGNQFKLGDMRKYHKLSYGTTVLYLTRLASSGQQLCQIVRGLGVGAK
eukprot:2559501-Pleurochrysis_carterae.AAC.2